MFSTGLLNAGSKLSVDFFLESMRLHETLSRRINIFRNILHKYAIHYRALQIDSTACLLVDEGISHIPYLFTGNLNDNNRSLFLKFPHNTKPLVIKLSIDLKTNIERLQHRGHPRIDDKKDTITKFAFKNSECSALQDKLLERYKNVEHFNIQDGNIVRNMITTLQKQQGFQPEQSSQ